MDEREVGTEAHVKQTTRTTYERGTEGEERGQDRLYQQPYEQGQERPYEQESTYAQRYPHPAQGLDRDAARKRVEQNPAVMPPNPSPATRAKSWQNREFFGMRALPLALVLGGGVLLPFLFRLFAGQKQPKEQKETMRDKASARMGDFAKMREYFEANQGGPRFIAWTSRPYGKAGKKGRGLLMAKFVAPPRET